MVRGQGVDTTVPGDTPWSFFRVFRGPRLVLVSLPVKTRRAVAERVGAFL